MKNFFTFMILSFTILMIPALTAQETGETGPNQNLDDMAYLGIQQADYKALIDIMDYDVDAGLWTEVAGTYTIHGRYGLFLNAGVDSGGAKKAQKLLAAFATKNIIFSATSGEFSGTISGQTYGVLGAPSLSFSEEIKSKYTVAEVFHRGWGQNLAGFMPGVRYVQYTLPAELTVSYLNTNFSTPLPAEFHSPEPAMKISGYQLIFRLDTRHLNMFSERPREGIGLDYLFSFGFGPGKGKISDKAAANVSDLTGGRVLSERKVSFFFYDLDIGSYLSYNRRSKGNQWQIGAGYQLRMSMDVLNSPELNDATTTSEARITQATYGYIISGPVLYFKMLL